MYRVYDTKKNRWIKEKFYIVPNTDLSVEKIGFFGVEKFSIIDDRYVIHKDIGAKDVNGIIIFEGDICSIVTAEDGNVIVGVIAYCTDNCSYCLFDNKNYKYYNLGEKYCRKNIAVLGNIFDNDNIIS